jgi:hypothetical protein
MVVSSPIRTVLFALSLLAGPLGPESPLLFLVSLPRLSDSPVGNIISIL